MSLAKDRTCCTEALGAKFVDRVLGLVASACLAEFCDVVRHDIRREDARISLVEGATIKC